jgi:glucosamine--fructose-6-phosphate aminotransferase (isomerizing)
VRHNWPLPRVWGPLSALAFLPALQLISYAFAASLGHDVDQPRNLAKSVTVE